MLNFPIHIQPGKPIYEQVIEATRKAVVQGFLKPGDTFPTVREIASHLKVNPNTVQKAITELKKEKVIESYPGKGSFVSAKREFFEQELNQKLSPSMEQLVVDAKHFGMSFNQLKEKLKDHWDQFDKESKL